MFAPILTKVKTLVDRFSLSLVILVSVLLLGTSTAFYFLLPHSLVGFFFAVASVVPLSSLTRFASRDIVLALEQHEHELLVGLVNGLFG